MRELDLLDFMREVKRSLDQMTENQRKTIIMRFGLDGQGKRSYAKVGEAIGLSRSRAQHLEAEGLRIMRLKNKRLRDFLRQ